MLASILSQEDFNIQKQLTIILITTEKLPYKYKLKLRDICKKYPWIKVSYLDED